MMKYREIHAWYTCKDFDNRHTMRCRGVQTQEKIGHRVSNGDPTAINNSLVVN